MESGNIFVFEKYALGIQEWSDGLQWEEGHVPDGFQPRQSCHNMNMRQKATDFLLIDFLDSVIISLTKTAAGHELGLV